MGFTGQLREELKAKEPSDYKHAWSPAWRPGLASRGRCSPGFPEGISSESALTVNTAGLWAWCSPDPYSYTDMSAVRGTPPKNEKKTKTNPKQFLNMPRGPLTIHQMWFSIVPQWCCLSLSGLWAITEPGQPPQGKGRLLENQWREH